MPLAGFLVDRGEMSFIGVVAAGTLGALLGALVIYYLGLKVGESRVRNWFQAYGSYLLMSEDDFDRALEKFEGNGKKIVLLGRLIPGARSLISLPAGLEQMNLGHFLLLTTIGTVIWNVILTAAGLMLGRNWQEVLGIIDTYELVVWLILGILVAIFIARRTGILGREVS